MAIMIHSPITGAGWRALGNVVLMVCQLLASGCREENRQDFVRVGGHVFIFNYRIATATYVVTLQRLKVLPEGASYIATFENPAKGRPLVTSRKIWSGTDPIAIESDPVSCIRKDVAYAYEIQIIDQGKIIQSITGKMKSTLDQTILPKKPLVYGPGYDQRPPVGKNSADIYSGSGSEYCAE